MSEQHVPQEEIFPQTVDLLLDWLDEHIKPLPATPTSDHLKLIHAQGKRDLVDFLMEWRQEEQNNG